MLDTRRSIETPEGVELGLRIAGPAARGYAWLIDLLIRFALYFALASVLGVLGRFGLGLFLIIIFVIEWFYPVVFELYNGGATPGKRTMGIKVVHDDGTEVNLSSSLLRNLLRSVDFLPVLYGLGLIFMLFNKDFKRLGDITAGTIVIYQEKSSVVSDIPVVTPHAPAIALNADEQKAIIQFAERQSSFTEQRGHELANIIQDVTHSRDYMGVKRLLQYANWMLGRR